MASRRDELRDAEKEAHVNRRSLLSCSTVARSSIALAILTALAGCGDDSSTAMPERTASSVVAAAPIAEDAPSAAALRAPHLDTELAATTPTARVAATAPHTQRASERATRGDVSVARLVLAADVVDRAPVGAGTTFRAADTERLFAFLEVRNDAATDGELVVVFRRTDSTDRDERGGVSLTVPAAQRRFRTWSFTRHAKAPGAWEAVVRTAGGDELATAPFVIE